jgi:hypothetical protein
VGNARITTNRITPATLPMVPKRSDSGRFKASSILLVVEKRIETQDEAYLCFGRKKSFRDE